MYIVIIADATVFVGNVIGIFSLTSRLLLSCLGVSRRWVLSHYILAALALRDKPYSEEHQQYGKGMG